ncbi:MAG: M1 family aminopeptidase [Bacteroidales bacterium]|nr:M1 family aminopeptidase [Bacteroidales bacterium]
MKNCFIFFLLIVLITQKSYSLHSDSIDVIHYSINLDITDFQNKFIKGYVEIVVTPKINNLNIMHLDLLGMIIDSILVDYQNVNNYVYNDVLLSIPLEPPKNIGDTFLVTIYYFGQPQQDTGMGWGGFIWTQNNAFNLGVAFESYPHNFGRAWFPCVDDFIDRATYDFNIIVSWPNNHMAVCNGLLKSVNDYCNGKRKCVWKIKTPIPSYLASVAVGEYVVLNDSLTIDKMHIPIQLWVFPSDTLKAKQSFINLKNILNLFIDKFGPYRWEKVGFVEVEFNNGAMEHATNIAYPKFAINGNTQYEKLYTHELSHHWFGNLITCSKAEEMWINEGWATFTEFLYDETYYGNSVYLSNKRNKLYNVLRYAHIEEGGYHALNNIPQQYTYGTSSYDKGALVVLNLRSFMGDSAFYASVKKMLQDFAFSHISSEQMANYLDSISGYKIKEFFNTWVFTPGFPHYWVDSVVGLGNNVYVIFSSEKLRGRNSYSQYAKTQITFFDSLWNTYTYDINLINGYGIDTIHLSISPITYCVDFYEKYNDAKTSDWKIIKSTGNFTFDKTHFSGVVSSISDSVLIRVTHHWVAPDNFKVPIPGLILSKERYWSIEGIFDSTFVMKGKFNYIKSNSAGGLDNELITNSIDSLVLVYRKNKYCNWQLIPFTRYGTPYNGYLIVDTLRKGEYAFAIWNWNQWHKVVENFYDKEIKIYPVPAQDFINIEIPENIGNVMKIYNILGRLLFETILEGNKLEKIDISDLPSGAYIVKIYGNTKILSGKFFKK